MAAAVYRVAPDVMLHFQKYESQFSPSIEKDEVFVSVVCLTRYSSWITINDRIVQIKGLYLTGLNVANIEYLSWFRERPAYRDFTMQKLTIKMWSLGARNDRLQRGEYCGVIKYFILTDQICSVLLINATRWLSHFTRQNIY